MLSPTPQEWCHTCIKLVGSVIALDTKKNTCKQDPWKQGCAHTKKLFCQHRPLGSGKRQGGHQPGTEHVR